jgi:hypothetical protein
MTIPKKVRIGCLLCLLRESRSPSTVASKVVARWSHHCAGHHKKNGLQGDEAIREYKCLVCPLSADVNMSVMANLLRAER